MHAAPADNIFGKILRGEIPSTPVYANELVYCFLDLYPQNPGHTLVVPRNYSPNITEADAADLAACLQTVSRLIPALKAATGALGVSVITNMGREAGQMIEYTHFHVIPRHPGDKVSFYQLGPEQRPQQLGEMAARIIAAMG
jgi:histidine triad (HIT) family protein